MIKATKRLPERKAEKIHKHLLFILLTLAVSMPHQTKAAETSTNLTVAQTQRPTAWAAPLTGEGLPNFFKVSDSLYRCAQPSVEGFKQLPAIGIKTVVNLREFHDDRKLMKNTGLAYEHIKFATWHPETEDIVRFLRIVTNTNNTPVLVHCQHGADRTGTMCAMYRIVVQGWTKEEAIMEMTTGGYGFHTVWDNLIKYIRELDIDNVKKQLAEKK